MPSCLGNVEETLVPFPGSRVGSFMSSQDANDRCLSYGLGSDLRGMLESGSVEGPSSLMAHQPSGDVGCISCSQEFPNRSQGPPCACPLRQHIVGLLLKSVYLRSRPGTSGSVCISRDVSLSTLVLAHASSSSRTGRDGANVAKASSVCISTDRSALGSPGESSGFTTPHCPHGGRAEYGSQL